MFNSITDAELNGKGLSGLPDVPGLSTTEMQAKFDELSLDVIIPKLNELVAQLNKTGLSEKKIVDILANNSDEIPTSEAVLAVLAELGGGDMLRAVYDSTRSGIVDDAEKLGGHEPEYFATQKGLLDGLDLRATKDELQNESDERKTEIAIERARIDNMQSIPEGGTTGDAALADIKIGYDGTEWETPGEAVRGQIGMVYENIPLAINENGELCMRV